MVRLGLFDISVVREDGTPFNEVLHQGQVYVVAEPDALFRVRCRVDHRLGSERLFNVYLKVDGRCVGYSKKLHKPGDEGDFKGFRNSADKMGISIDLFKFASPTVNGTVEAQSLEFSQGKIDVEVWEVAFSGQTKPANRAKGPISSAQAVPALPEGKKFFLAPSLTTVAGGQTTIGRLSTKIYNKVKTVSEAKVTLRYETPTTLLLRKILTRDNPVHARILNSYPETRQQQQQTRGPAESMQSNHVGVKRERSVAGGSGSRSVETIDLSGVNPGNAEFLACYLTADEGAPRWEKWRGG